MTKRTFTQEDLIGAAHKFMRDNYPDLKREEPDRYYSVFGALFEFVTDLIPIEKDADND